MSDSTQTITGTIIRYAAGWHDWMDLDIDRGPEDKYEAEHPDRTIIRLGVSPYVAKKLTLTVGLMVEVDYRLTGREYNGKRYLSANVQSVRIPEGQVQTQQATLRAPAMAEPLPEDRQYTAEDQNLPF